jgi:uncharacterized membrane protein
MQSTTKGYFKMLLIMLLVELEVCLIIFTFIHRFFNYGCHIYNAVLCQKQI